MKVSENIKRIVKNEILLDTDLDSDDDFLKVIKLSEVILKKNPLFESKYSELINEIIFDILRKNNMVVNNIVLFIIIGIKDFTREHIQLSTKELSDVLVNQSNEVKLNDKLNTALSSIMDRSPKDIREQINPDTKTKILLFLKDNEIFSNLITGLLSLNDLIRNFLIIAIVIFYNFYFRIIKHKYLSIFC